MGGASMPRYRVVISDSSHQRMRRFLATLIRGRTREVRWSGEVGSRALAVEEAHNAWVEHFHEPVPAKPVVECTQLSDSGVIRGRSSPERRMAENVAIERLRFGRERGSAFAVEVFPGEEGYLPPPGATDTPPPVN